ncbi:MAG: hypothetical protein HQK59_17775, partial [Deltaproteobacteria bacterium]|nr:hypothetical protein [Deltaproteobacteria bacterium]
MIIEVPKNTRRKFGWGGKRKDSAEQVIQAAEELREFWPLTLRQLYYRLVASGAIPNKKSAYKTLSELVKNMRKAEMLEWGSIEDRGRRVSAKLGFTSPEAFLEQELKSFLEGYSRCLVQEQRNHLELWIEKDALSQVFQPIADTYCIRTVICKGFSSVTLLRNFYERASRALERDQTPIVI